MAYFRVTFRIATKKNFKQGFTINNYFLRCKIHYKQRKLIKWTI